MKYRDYEEETGATELKTFESDGDKEVVDLDGNTYEVSEELYRRIRASSKDGVDRPTVELEDGRRSGLYDEQRLRYFGWRPSENTEEDEESGSEEAGQVSKWVDDT